MPNTIAIILFMSILLKKCGMVARRSCTREGSTARNSAQRSAEGDEPPAIENEIDTDGHSDEPEARGRQLREQHDAKSHGDDPGEDRPAPLRELQGAGANCPEQAADHEKRREHQGQTV